MKKPKKLKMNQKVLEDMQSEVRMNSNHLIVLTHVLADFLNNEEFDLLARIGEKEEELKQKFKEENKESLIIT